MAPQDVFDIDGLLTPLEGETGTGADLRESGDADYARLKDARRRVVSLARQGRADPTVESEINQAWQLISELAPEVLQSRAKDLEVAAWLTEAELRRKGLAGLHAGLCLIEGLVDGFWDHLHPMPDEDGLETRLYPLVGLNGEDGNGSLVAPIRNTPLSDDPDTPLTANLLQRCREAAAIEDPELRRARFQEIGLDAQGVQQQAARCDQAFCQALLADAEASAETLKRLSSKLDQHCGAQHAPPVSALRESLEMVVDAIRNIYGPRLSTEPQTAPEAPIDAPPTPEKPPAGEPTMPVATGPIQSRQEALQQLQAIADYFRRQEPHSPIAGAIERVARWARLPLDQLLQELIPDARAREHYALITGVDISAGPGAATPPPPAEDHQSTTAAQPENAAGGSDGFSW